MTRRYRDHQLSKVELIAYAVGVGSFILALILSWLMLSGIGHAADPEFFYWNPPAGTVHSSTSCYWLSQGGTPEIINKFGLAVAAENVSLDSDPTKLIQQIEITAGEAEQPGCSYQIRRLVITTGLPVGSYRVWVRALDALGNQGGWASAPFTVTETVGELLNPPPPPEPQPEPTPIPEPAPTPIPEPEPVPQPEPAPVLPPEDDTPPKRPDGLTLSGCKVIWNAVTQNVDGKLESVKAYTVAIAKRSVDIREDEFAAMIGPDDYLVDSLDREDGRMEYTFPTLDPARYRVWIQALDAAGNRSHWTALRFRVTGNRCVKD